MSEIKPKRPGVVLAAAVMLFIFGGISVLEICLAALPYLTPGPAQAKQAGPGNIPELVEPTPKLLAEEPVLMGVLAGFAVVGALLGVAKIWAGLGILRLRPAARTAGMALAFLSILLGIAQSAYSALYYIPAYLRIFVQENVPPITDFLWLFEAGLWGVTIVSAIGTIAIWLTVILLLNSRRAHNAFAGISNELDLAPEPEPRPRYEGYEDEEDYPRSAPPSTGDTGITDRST
jgi:hypothetical protein